MKPHNTGCGSAGKLYLNGISRPRLEESQTAIERFLRQQDEAGELAPDMSDGSHGF